MKKFNFKFLFMFFLLSLLALSFVACGEEKTKTNEGTKTPVVDPGNNTETPTPVVPSGNTETPTPVVVKEVASIEVDQDSVDAVLKEEIFNYHNILIVVTYADGTTENLNLDDSMLSEAELSKITAFGRKKIEVTFGGKSCSFSINIPRSSLYGIEVNEESLKAALSADYFDFTSINIDLVYTNNTRTSMPLASSMFTMREIAELYTAGDKSFTINYSGKTTTLEYKNDKDLIIALGDLSGVADGQIIAVKAYVTTYSSSTIYIFDSTSGTYATAISGLTSSAHTSGLLDDGKEVLLVGYKASNEGLATVTGVCGITSTGNSVDVNDVKEINKSSDISSNLYSYVDLVGTKVSVVPTVFSSNSDCVFKVTDGTDEITVVVPKDTDDTFTQALYCTLAQLCVTHEVTFEKVLAAKYENNNAIFITTDSKVSYVSLADEYHRPEEGEKNEEFEALLDELLLWFLGDNPFDINYLIYDVKAFDEKYGTDLVNAKVEPSSLEDMTPEAELEYYQELLDVKAQVEAFDYDTLSHSEKIAYKVILDKIQRSMNFFLFDDNGKNLLFYYGIQLGSYLGYQAQLPSLLSDCRFDDKKDIDDYLDFMYYTKSDFEAIYYFEKSKIESGEGNQIADFVIDLVIEQCDNFINTDEVNYLITLFNDRIYDYDFLTEEEAKEYQEKNEKYINEYFIPAYAWLKEQLTELKDINDDSKSGGLANLEYGKEYYQVYFQSQCGTDMTIDELIEYIAAKEELADKAIWTSYSGNLMSDAGLIKYDGKKQDYYASLYSIIPFNQEKCAADFPSVKASYVVGENIKINEIPEALQENSSPAYYMTSPIDATTNEFFYINPPEFSELGNYMYQTVSHEAWPGHLYQTVYFKETDNHDIRKVISYTSYAEGWAEYVENYVPKYVIDDYGAQQMFLYDLYSSLAYCKLDIGINYQGWDVEDIIEYYGLTLEDVNSGRYTWTSGDTVSYDDFEGIYYRFVEVPSNYLKYYLGACLILDMKAEFKELMGVYYSDKVFHTILLETGEASWDIIRQELLDYASKWGTNGTNR